jgi:hypothetical protein
MWHGLLNEADSAAGWDELSSAVWLCEWGDSVIGSATMVIPSLSRVAPWRPHIGSGAGGGTFFAAIPDSQCPAAFPEQHGIVLTLLKAAFAMRNGSAATKRHRKSRTPMERILRFVYFFVAIAGTTTEPVLVGQAS